MKKILTFILALVFTFNIGNTFSQNNEIEIVDTIVFNDDNTEYELNIKYYINIYNGYDKTGITNFLIDLDENIEIYFDLDSTLMHNGFYTSDNVLYTLDLNNNATVISNNTAEVLDSITKYETLTYSFDFSSENNLNFSYRTVDNNNQVDTIFQYTVFKDSASYNNVVNPTANIEEHNKVKVTDINVYPNPVVNSITVEFETDLQDLPVELYSMNGQLLEINNDNRYFGRNSVQMEMYDYPKGMYLIKVGGLVRKVVKN